MVRFECNNIRNQDVYLEDIGLCAENLSTTIGSILEIARGRWSFVIILQKKNMKIKFGLASHPSNLILLCA